MSFVIPQPLSGFTVLGGCQLNNTWNNDEEVKMSGQINDRCAALAPNLLTGPGKSFEVLGCQVSPRPFRTGGARVKREAVHDDRGYLRWVIHVYGHDGPDVQNSIGVAEKVSRLVAEVAGGVKTRLYCTIPIALKAQSIFVA